MTSASPLLCTKTQVTLGAHEMLHVAWRLVLLRTVTWGADGVRTHDFLGLGSTEEGHVAFQSHAAEATRYFCEISPAKTDYVALLTASVRET